MEGQKLPRQNETNWEFLAKSELFANEDCLKNYNKDVINKITQGFSRIAAISNSQSVLEFGAGVGALAAVYENQNGVKPDCIELDKKQLQLIRERGFNCCSTIQELTKKYDFIYSSNVLEHIEDDVATLSKLYQYLKPGGGIAIYVPAFMCLWSEMDEAVGHYRRYTRKELKQKATFAGFKVTSCYYVDSVGFFAWLYLRLKGYKANASAPKKSMRFYDNFLYPISKAIDWLGCRYLFGKNLMLIAKK